MLKSAVGSILDPYCSSYTDTPIFKRNSSDFRNCTPCFDRAVSCPRGEAQRFLARRRLKQQGFQETRDPNIPNLSDWAGQDDPFYMPQAAASMGSIFNPGVTDMELSSRPHHILVLNSMHIWLQMVWSPSVPSRAEKWVI